MPDPGPSWGPSGLHPLSKTLDPWLPRLSLHINIQTSHKWNNEQAHLQPKLLWAEWELRNWVKTTSRSSRTTLGMCEGRVCSLSLKEGPTGNLECWVGRAEESLQIWPHPRSEYQLLWSFNWWGNFSFLHVSPIISSWWRQCWILVKISLGSGGKFSHGQLVIPWGFSFLISPLGGTNITSQSRHEDKTDASKHLRQCLA